ncbi:MAG: flagellar biosynthetic protein FliO [Chlamydiales bacterium]|nr:flagellar biosynthetic protein FliO [Chlamydiales bacterium]
MISWIAQLSASLESPPAEASSVTEMTTNYGSAIAHMLLTFTAVIVLLFVSFWFLRRLIQNRLQKGGGDQAIQILEKRMISPKTMLYWIEVDGKKILIAESHLEVRKIESYISSSTDK